MTADDARRDLAERREGQRRADLDAADRDMAEALRRIRHGGITAAVLMDLERAYGRHIEAMTRRTAR